MAHTHDDDPQAVDQSYEKGAHPEEHGGVGVYVAVALALVVLTSFSYATNLPFWDTLVGDSLAVKRTWMMAVSCTKAMLVILFFMHLKWEANWKWVLTVPASMMSALLILALVPDVGRRMRYASHERLVYAPAEAVGEPRGEDATSLPEDAEEPVHEPAGH